MDQHLFDINPNPILIFEKDSLAILKGNNAFCKKYGYTEEEISDLTLYDIRPDESKEILDKIISNRDPDKKNETGIVKHCSKDGILFYVTVSGHPVEYKGMDARIVFIHDVTERIEAEKKARQAFDELHHHVNNSPLALIKWNADFEVIEWSNRAKEITGYPKEQVLGKTPDLFYFYEDDYEIVEQMMGELVSGTRDALNFEVKLYGRDGELVDVKVHASVLRNKEDELISVLTFFEDITEQNKAKLRYRRLFNNANDGIFLMKNTKFVECNPQVLNIYGCTKKEEILGKTPIDFSPEQQPDGQKSLIKARKKIQKALDGKPQVFEWKHTQLDGTLIDVEVSLNRLDLGKEVFVQAIVRDLTEQKKAQKKLRRSEKLFRKLFLKAPGAILMVDKQNKVQRVNQSFEELFGYSEQELLGKDIDDIIVGKSDTGKTLRMPGDGFKDGKFYEDIVRYTKQGEERHLLLGAIPVYLDDEPIAGFGIYIDITEQKEYEYKLQQSLEEKQVLLEEIHHRVKNNLAIISGLLQLQAFETEDEQTKNALNDSQLRIQSMALVHEMLYQSENFVDISFETYLNKLVDIMKATLPFNHQHIEIDIETKDVSLDINQAIPCAILINELVTNSYKHAFKDRESGTIFIHLDEDEEYIVINVGDDGVGLPDDFSIAEQSSIGMNLVQTLTDQLNGTLEIQRGEGSYFSVRFEKSKRNGEEQLGLFTAGEK